MVQKSTKSHLFKTANKHYHPGWVVPDGKHERMVRSKLKWRQRHHSEEGIDRRRSGRCCPFFVDIYKIAKLEQYGLVC